MLPGWPFILALPLVASFSLISCTPSGEEEGEARRSGSPEVAAVSAAVPLVAYPRRPVPPDLAPLWDEAVSLRRSREFTRLADAYSELLPRLEEFWGPSSPKLAVYHYELALALELSGNIEESLAAAQDGVSRWPRSVRHRLFDATERMKVSSRRGHLVEGTESSVERLLRPENRGAIRAVKVEPADLHAQWAALLLELGRAEEALEEVRTAAELRPATPADRLLHARVLTALRRSGEVARVLEPLEEAERTPEASLLLGTAYLETGRPAEAWELLRAVIETATPPSRDDAAEDAGEPVPLPAKIVAEARRRGAAALNRLERFADARRVILPVLVGDPQDETALHHLAAALRGTGRGDAASAVRARARELTELVRHRREKERSERTRRPAAAAYHEARGFLAIGRTGDALEALHRGIAAEPRVLSLHLLRIETLVEVGRLWFAFEAAAEAREETRSPVVRAVMARLLARTGEVERARAMLRSLEEFLAETGGTEIAALSNVYRARVLCELGAVDEARAAAGAVPPSGRESVKDPRALELARLARASLLVLEGELDRAATLLDREVHLIEGGESWSGALRLITRLGTGKGATEIPSDLSDLVDHTWLLRRARALPAIRERDETREAFDKAIDVARKRSRILGKMRDLADRDVLALWRELIELYLETETLEKAREAAWYVRSRNPAGLEENLLLLRSLRRPEDVLARLSVIEDALSHAVRSSEILRLREEALRFLGETP